MNIYPMRSKSEVGMYPDRLNRGIGLACKIFTESSPVNTG